MVGAWADSSKVGRQPARREGRNSSIQYDAGRLFAGRSHAFRKQRGDEFLAADLRPRPGHIAITGSGTFDGQAGKNAWWDWKASGGKDSETLRQMGEDDVAAANRRFGAGHQLRPNFVQPHGCRNVLIEGVTFVNSPMWILNPVLCQNVTVRGVTVSSHGPNNDGCNPESCRDVLIENCTFDTGDDCIAIKSGRNADGRRIGVPSENIIIRGCPMKDGHGGVVLGSEMSGGIRNVFVEDCVMGSPNLERAIRLKVQFFSWRLSGKPVRPQCQDRPGEGSGRTHQSAVR